MSESGVCIEFGPFRLFPAERKLLKDEAPVVIGSRALDVLIALTENAGKVVTKRELLAKAWPGSVVEESSLRVQVAGLRRALADATGEGRYVLNVPGRGYMFVASPATNLPSRNWIGTSPALPGRVIGRHADIQVIGELLEEHRFVTIHGAGGIGKTTLGLAVAELQARTAHDGVCFVDLGLGSGNQSAADALASALGLSIRTSDTAASILDFIGSREMLLIFDSCEARIDSAALLAESIFDGAAGVRVLATSREPLRARGEHVYALAPLASPPMENPPTASGLLQFSAAQLFCERAEESGYRVELGDADAAIIGDICRRLGGNPLALELAASRVGTYGLLQTAELLDSHMRLAWRGRRTAPPRHQSLTAMLDWSYALLNEQERALLRQLAIFVGPFGLDEVRGVADGGDERVQVLEQLVMKSLVATDAGSRPVRYRLLDTTREFARAKLVESGTAGETARRHARYYLDWLTRSAVCAEVSPEQVSNIRAAVDWALSDVGEVEAAIGLAAYGGELFIRLGMLTDARRWAERALAVLPPHLEGSLQDLTLRASLAHVLMFTLGNRGGVQEALEHALALAEGLNERMHQFRILCGLFMFQRRTGEFEKLLPIARQAEAIATSLGGAAPSVVAQAMLGVSHHLNGNLAEALRTLNLVRDAPVDPSALMSFYGFHRDAEVLIARTLWLQGFPDQAAATADHANRADEPKDPVTECLCLIWGVSVHYLRGDWDSTESYLQRMLDISIEHSLVPVKWFALALRGDLQWRRGEFAAGMGSLRAHLGLLIDGGYNIYTPWLTCCVAEGLATQHHTDEALRLLDAFYPEADARRDVYMAEFLRVKGAILAQAGNVAKAQRLFESSLEMANAQGAQSWRLRTATSYAHLLLAQRQRTQARIQLAEVYGRFTEGFETQDLRKARALIAQLDGG